MSDNNPKRTPGQLFAAALHQGRGVEGVEVRALVGSSTSDTSAAGVLAPSAGPQTPYGRRRRLWVPDLLRRIPTGMNRIPYIRELNPLANENGASAVGEASPKPELTVQFQGEEAFVRKVAGWIPMTTEILDDGDGLAAYLDARLPRILKAREEQQILNGAGGTVEIRGLRNTPGIRTTTGPVGDTVTALAQGARAVEQGDGFASGVVMNVDDHWAMVMRRAGDGHYDLDPFADDDEWSVWKATIVRTRAMPAGKALVGDWEALGLIRDREQVTIRLATQHDDYLTRGRLAAVVEQREALTVEQPDLLCEVTLA